MADFNEGWDTDNPSDDTNATQIDDYINNTRAMIEERLQDMIYGFTSGEDTDAPGFKKVTALVQNTAPSTPTNAIELYGFDVSSKCELHAKDEDGDVVQLTTGGNIGGANVELLAGKDLLGSSTSDIAMNTDKFTVAGATGNTAIAGTLDVAGVATLGDGSLLAAATEAGDDDRAISDKAYVDGWGQVCRVWCDAAQAMPANSTTKIEFDTDSYDPDNVSDLTNHRITPDKEGYYQVNAGLLVSSLTGGAVYYEILIYKNGAAVARKTTATGQTFVGLHISDIVHCNGSTDYIEIFFRNGHSSNAGALSGLEPNDYLSVARIDV